MSHIAKIELEITDLESLKQACNQIGFHFMENQQTYKWYGEWIGDSPLPEYVTVEDLGKCDHAIHVPEATYEIGLIRDKENRQKYTLLWDSWIDGGLEKAVGKNAGRIKQAYTIQRIRKEARLKGYTVSEQKMNDRIRISCTFR